MFLVSLVSQGEQPERPEWHEQDSLQRLGSAAEGAAEAYRGAVVWGRGGWLES